MNHLERRQQYQRGTRENNDWRWLPTRNPYRRPERDLNEGYTLYYAPNKGYTLKSWQPRGTAEEIKPSTCSYLQKTVNDHDRFLKGGKWHMDLKQTSWWSTISISVLWLNWHQSVLSVPSHISPLKAFLCFYININKLYAYIKIFIISS